MKIEKACKIIRLPRNRYYRWLRGRSFEDITPYDLEDRPPIARVIPHKLTDVEKEIIIEESSRDEYAGLRHRKLSYTIIDKGIEGPKRMRSPRLQNLTECGTLT